MLLASAASTIWILITLACFIVCIGFKYKILIRKKKKDCLLPKDEPKNFLPRLPLNEKDFAENQIKVVLF